MYKRSEGFFKGYQDINLFFQIWENPNAKGTIIFTHGHGEHSESYHRLTSAFENDSWSFYGWDLRGHGKSDGRRGYASEFDDYCRDYKIFLDMVLQDEKVRKGPVILLCHSMGALIELKTLMRNPDLKFDGIVVSSPLLGLAITVPAIKSRAASILHKLLPQVTLGNELDNSMLSSDVDVLREYEQDSLRHTRMSPGVFLGMLESWNYVRPRANEIKKPALFQLPEHDPVCSTPDAKSFYEKMGSKRKEIYIYPNAKHEIYNDVMRNTAFADLKKFLDSFLESK
ncbi:alpha/beta hydrolase [Bdellovibrio svalbardensis]|uniref:Lysophospholipase n=1 Tax=Bdellovibrio svalbardensis TaxID=2972972 RepID=A0ABT6DH65_9BACT|nr:alpha/beta hydrolase [Bdellovibrio svalbardensis]MDG0815600.1 lysophospholipase [Bdellovibrio svalbardensis]